MGWKNWIDYKIGLIFSLIFVINIIIGFIYNYFTWATALQLSIIIGFVSFIVMGIIGKLSWKYRWFKILLIPIVIILIYSFLEDINLIHAYGIDGMTYYYLHNI